MATIHLSGTKLSLAPNTIPTNSKFLASIGILFLFSMHIFMPNPGGSGLALSFNTTTWIAFSISLGIGCYHLASSPMIRYTKLTIGLLISCILLTIPIFYSTASGDFAADRLLGLWSGFLFLVILQQFQFNNKHRQRLLWFIVFAVIIEAIFGLVQCLYLEPDNIFGYNTDANRPYGIFQQPNVMASFLATGLIFSSYLLSRQPYKYERKRYSIYILYLVPVLTLPLLLVLASRTGWLTTIVSLLLITPYMYNFVPKGRFYCWLLSLISGVALGIAITGTTGAGSDSIANKADLESPRRYTFPQTLDMVIEKPFTGYGYGNFESAYTLYTARQHAINEQYPPGLPAMDHPHNELLLWAVEGGIVPLLGIFLAMGLTLYRIYSAKRGTRLALLALFIPIVFHTQLEYPFYHSFVHWLIFIILLFWVDQRVSRYRQTKIHRLTSLTVKISSLVIPIVCAIYMASALHTNYVLTKFEKTRPLDPEILGEVTNPVVWKDRFDWDVFSTYLNIGLYTQDPKLIQPYINWSLEIIKDKPRPAFYNNLILAYQGMGDDSKAEQVRAEAQFLFPGRDFSEVNFSPVKRAVSSTSEHSIGGENEQTVSQVE